MSATVAMNPFGHADDGLFVEVTRFAIDTRWLNTAMLAYSSVGIALLGLLIILVWWRARSRDAAVMTRALAVPVAAIAAYIGNFAIKLVVAEHRPCYAFPHAYIIEACPSVSDYSFPSNHTAVAFAIAIALYGYDRRFGLLAGIIAVAMGFSRVYDGAHYPHDVLIGAVVGSVIAAGTVAVMSRYATPLVRSLSEGPLRPVLTDRS